MSKFHLYHISFFDSLLNGLRSNGVALDEMARQSYIRHFDLNAPNTYLPLEVSYEFFKKVKESQGIDCISCEFYGKFHVGELSEYGQYLSACPDLHSILLNAIEFDYQIQTSGQLRLEINGALSRFSMLHTDPFCAGREVSERINMTMFIKTFQMVLGLDWTPLEVQVTTCDGEWLKNIFPSSDFRLKTSCNEIAFCFKTKELAAKNKYHLVKPGLKHRDLRSMEALTKTVFNSLEGNYLPTQEELAEYFGYSKRTVIRRFNKTGTSYQEMLDNHLFMRALDFLEDEKLSIQEISDELGYAHPSNFIKAFKRLTTTTPLQYRQHASGI